MYDRAPRVLAATAPLTRTASTIGPGTYAVKDHNKLTIGYAPFLSLSKRESFLTISDEVAITPAPGHYNVDKTNKGNVKGGKALQNKSRRFSSASSLAPGPGTYTVPSLFIQKKKNTTSNTNGVKKSPSKDKGKEKTYSSGRITYKRLETAPSIPIPGVNNGFQKDEVTGKLEPQFFENKDPTIGPAYYKLTNDPTVATKKYKGVHFGVLKSQRTDFKGRSGPGPSDYDPVMTTQGTSVAIQHVNAKLPRYHEIVPQQEEKKGVPGPDKYNLPSQFEAKDQQIVTFENAIEPPPFGSSQQRFINSVSFTPPSTKYDDPRTAMDALKKISGLVKTPFGQTAARFKTDRNAKEIPGPGAYDDATTKKQLTSSVHNYPFGTTSVRTAPIIKKDEHYQPGPAQYHPLFVCVQSTGNKPSSMFSSTSKRLYSPPPIVTTIPPPGSYEVHQSFSRSQGKVDVQYDTQYSAFLSSNNRFAPPRDISLNETDSINPGPGEYEYQEHGKVGLDNNGLICSRDKRFKKDKKSSLGPGAYKLSKQQQHTLLRGTHNITLNDPLKDGDDSDETKKKHGHISNENKKQIIILTV